MWPNGGDKIQVVCALFLYDSDNTGVVCVLCPNDGDNTHAVRALMEELKHVHPSTKGMKYILDAEFRFFCYGTNNSQKR